MKSDGISQKNYFCIIIVLFCLSLANADIVTLPLPSLNGSYTGTFGGPGTGRTANANFETEFLTIDQVHIHLIGTYTEGIGHNYSGESGNVFGELTASMSGWATMSRILQPVETQFDFNLLFRPFVNPEEDWGVLMDGEADITVKLGMFNMYDVIDQRPTVIITFAEISIEGSPVPEPSTLLLLITGMIIFRKKGL